MVKKMLLDYKVTLHSRLATGAVDDGSVRAGGRCACFIARTYSPAPVPHFVNTESAWVNGRSTGWTRSGGRM